MSEKLNGGLKSILKPEDLKTGDGIPASGKKPVRFWGPDGLGPRVLNGKVVDLENNPNSQIIPQTDGQEAIVFQMGVVEKI